MPAPNERQLAAQAAWAEKLRAARATSYAPPTDIERAIRNGIASAGGAVSDAMAPNEMQIARQAAWAEKLKAARATPGVLENLLMRLRGPQMPAAIPQGSLAEILNGQRVANPNPSVTPSPPIIGVRG